MTEFQILFGIISITVVILLLVSGIAISFLLTNRQKLSKQIALKEVDMHHQRELREMEINITESNINRVAGELHDNVGQLLTVLNLQMENIMLDKPQSALELLPLKVTLAQVTAEVRTLSRTLNSEFVKEQKISSLVKMEVDKLHSLRRFELIYDHDDHEPNLTKEQLLIAFRIFQETINNILKHSEASMVQIKLYGENKFFLEIMDNGIGYDLSKLQAINGLKNIYNRAKDAAFQVDISSEEGKGSSTTLSIQ